MAEPSPPPPADPQRRSRGVKIPVRVVADEPLRRHAAAAPTEEAGHPPSAPRPKLAAAGFVTDRAAQELPPSEPEPPAADPPAQIGNNAGGEPCSRCRQTARAADEELARAKERIERDAERRGLLRERQLLIDLLEVVDNLDRAIESARDGEPAVLQGIELVRDDFLQKLGERGVSRESAAEGAEFDPRRHEAFATTAVDDPFLDGRITRVIRPGYRCRQEMLRPAGVIVGKWARAA